MLYSGVRRSTPCTDIGRDSTSGASLQPTQARLRPDLNMYLLLNMLIIDMICIIMCLF